MRALWLRSVELSVRIKNIVGNISIADRRTLVSIWSQDRRRSQKCVSIWSQAIAELSAICDLRSSAIIWKPAFNNSNVGVICQWRLTCKPKRFVFSIMQENIFDKFCSLYIWVRSILFPSLFSLQNLLTGITDNQFGQYENDYQEC